MTRDEFNAKVDNLTRFLTYPELDDLHMIDDCDAAQREQIRQLEAQLADAQSALNEHMVIHAETVNRVKELEERLAKMYAQHPESGGCYAALPKLRAKLAEREAEVARLKEVRRTWYQALSDKEVSDPEYVRGYISDFGIDFDRELKEKQRWKAEAQWVASLALSGGPVTPKDAQRFQNIMKGDV